MVLALSVAERHIFICHVGIDSTILRVGLSICFQRFTALPHIRIRIRPINLPLPLSLVNMYFFSFTRFHLQPTPDFPAERGKTKFGNKGFT